MNLEEIKVRLLAYSLIFYGQYEGFDILDSLNPTTNKRRWKRMKKKEMIFGLDRVGVYWTIRILALTCLVMSVWFIAIPNLQQTFQAISILIREMMVSESSPEFKLIILFVTVWVICTFISIAIRVYDKVWKFTKEGLEIDLQSNDKLKKSNNKQKKVMKDEK